MTTQKQIGNKNYIISEEARKIAEKVIEEEKLLSINDVKVEYMIVYPDISKTTVGRCYKANKHTKFYSNNDFLLEFSGETWDKLSEEVRYRLVLHELLHIKVWYNKKQEMQLGIRDHDVQDFSYLIQKYGISWLTDLKTQFSSVQELDPEDEEKITL